ncbi:MAG: gamma-glutamyltransferase [Polyangiaceae bacterium]|nr:gamma-glutamyltransferase [Polyangiaceae bacterium]
MRAHHLSLLYLGWALTAIACRPSVTQHSAVDERGEVSVTRPASAEIAYSVQPASLEQRPAAAAPAPSGKTESNPHHPALRDIKDSPIVFHFDGPHVIRGEGGVVTSVEEAATRAGIEILEAGGNAIDAAVATAFALAVTHPSAGNIGGGGFLVAKIKGDALAVDFRENSPAGLTQKVFWDTIQGRRPPHAAVGVPGTVAGLHLAHARHGSLPWAELVAPAIRLAEEGHIFGARQEKTLDWVKEELWNDETARSIYWARGWPARRGYTIKNPRLGLALRRIANEGPAGFYEGPTAEDIVDSLGKWGVLTLDDLKNYRAEFRDPLHFDYRGTRVITMPSPSAGGVAVTQILKMMESSGGYATPPLSIERYHYFAEASRRAQAERRFFVTAPGRLDPEAQALARQRWLDPMTWLKKFPIRPQRATRSYLLTPLFHQAIKEVPHTTHFSVIDRNGDAVSCTVTLSGSFGIRRYTKKTGIALNNSVASFGSVGDNIPAAGVRTVSSMAPTVVIKGEGPEQEVLALGSPGGDTIPSTVTQVFLHLTDGKSLFDAVNAPRIHHAFVPDSIAQEKKHPLKDHIRIGLRRLGQDFGAMPPKMGDANIAAAAGGRFYAVSDWREGGLALGAARPSDRNIAELEGELPPREQASYSPRQGRLAGTTFLAPEKRTD